MATTPQRPKVLVVVGPTASGKSELALAIAQKYDGEIIAVDSRTIYRHMDIGTAKPTKADQIKIKHWGLDLINPGQNYSVKHYKDYADLKIKDILRRGKLPILVGGSGLYIDSVVFDFKLRKTNADERQRLEQLSTQQLQAEILANKHTLPSNSSNRRHLIRVLESDDQVSRRQKKPLPGIVIVGLNPPDDVLRRRIAARAENMFGAALMAETKHLIDEFGESALKNSRGIVYRFCQQVIDGTLTRQQAVELFKTADWQYARRQRTWFKRNKFILWQTDVEGAEHALKLLLNT